MGAPRWGLLHRSHIHLTAKPFNGPLPGGAGPPVPKGKGPKSMAPGSPGSSLPETSQLSLTILPRASEKGLREGGPVACPYSLPPHSRLAPGDQAAGTEVLATKALSLVLSHGQVQGQGCVSGILGPPPSPQARRGSAIAPPITMSPQLLPAPRVGPGFRTGPRQFRRSEGERGASSEGQRGAHPAPRAEGRSFHVWPSWKSPPPRASDSVWRVGQGTRGHSGALLETAGRPRQLAGPVPSWGTRPGAEGGGTGSGPPPLQCPSRLSLVAGRAPRTGGAGGRAEGARVRGAPAREQQALKAADLCEPPGSSGSATLSPLALCLGAPLGHTHYLQVTPFSSDLESWPVPPVVPEPPAPGPGSGTCFLSPLIAPLPASLTAPATSSHIRK